MQKRNKRSPSLTAIQKEDIRQMVFGPFKYHPEWRDDKGVIDNRDEVIGERLGVPKEIIANYVSVIMEQHFEKVYKQIEEDPKYIFNVCPTNPEQLKFRPMKSTHDPDIFMPSKMNYWPEEKYITLNSKMNETFREDDLGTQSEKKT